MAEQYIPQNVLDALPKRFETKTVQTPTGRMGGGFYENQVIVPPPNAIPVMGKGPAMPGGARDVPTGEYYIPLNIPNYPKTDAGGYPVPPLIAKYDAQGNLQTITAQTRYLGDAVNNIGIQPEYNLKGELVSTNPVNNAEGEGGGFGDFLSTALKDFGPMIALGVGAKYLAPLLSGGGAAAAGGAGVSGGLMGSTLPAGAGAGGYYASGVTAGAATLGIPTMTGAPAGVTAGIPSGAGGAGMLSGAPVTPPVAAPPAAPAIPPAAPVAGAAAGAAGTGITSSMLSAISKATGISVDDLKTFAPSVIQGLLSAGGSYLQSEQGKEAAQTQADAAIRAAQIAADAVRFRPVGVTTRFSSSKFKTDAAGNVIEAGYTPSAEITGYQDRLRTLAGQDMTDIEGARAAYQPLTGAAQRLFSLGGSYIKKSPEEVAADYISKQRALIAPSRELQLSNIRNVQQQQGRGGLSVAQGGNLMATNPELAAYYNSVGQQDLILAAQADEEARRRISYGAELFDTGAGLQGKYYTGQTGSYAPFATAMDTSSALESLAERPLTLGTSIGEQTTAGTAAGGRFLSQGITNAAQTMAPANAYSGTGNLLRGVGESTNVAGLLNNAFGVQPQQTALDAEKLRLFKLIYGT